MPSKRGGSASRASSDDQSGGGFGPPTRPDWLATKVLFDVSQPIRLLATIITLTVDEILAFPLTALIGFGIYWFAPYMSPDVPTQHLWELAARQLLRMFGDFGAVCLLECALKFLFALPRPPWMKKKANPYYAMAGEWYCFPSGHSMRAAYISVILRDVALSPAVSFIEAATGSLETAIAFMQSGAVFYALTGWALVAAWSRIALGKHFLGDVVVGLILGFGIAHSPYPVLLPGHPRTAMLACFVTQNLVIMSRAKWRRLVRGWPCLLAINCISTAILPHCVADRAFFVSGQTSPLFG